MPFIEAEKYIWNCFVALDFLEPLKPSPLAELFSSFVHSTNIKPCTQFAFNIFLLALCFQVNNSFYRKPFIWIGGENKHIVLSDFYYLL